MIPNSKFSTGSKNENEKKRDSRDITIAHCNNQQRYQSWR
jgi:hypothetical protein